MKVYLAEQTFEYELYVNNEDIMKSAYTDFNSTKETVSERALEFVAKLGNGKAIFAQHFADFLAEHPEGFVVPDYIHNAIRWVVEGK